MDSRTRQIVFCVTSTGGDIFCAMTRIAVASIRLTNPQVKVVIACDQQTNLALRDAREPMMDEVDDWVAVNTPPGSAVFRNRYCKTSLRSIISGAFLFLDSDTLVRKDLSEIFELDCDIAAARNHSRDSVIGQISIADRATLKHAGWQVCDRAYINGGVLFYNDTPDSRKFAAEWHRLWLEANAKSSSYRDQPSLNTAIASVNPSLTLLDHRFNAQVMPEPKVAGNAAIWHFYSSEKNSFPTDFELLVAEVASIGVVNSRRVQQLISAELPWRNGNPVDSFVGKSLSRKGVLSGWQDAWLRRQYWKSMKCLARALKTRIFV
jgi:hypothetical protein